MLKPADTPPGGNDRPIGELVSQLVDDGKAYAQAEIDLVKAIAADKAADARTAAILLGLALLIALGAVVALCVGIVLALATFTGPLLGGVLAFILIGAVAGLLGWLGAQKIRALLLLNPKASPTPAGGPPRLGLALLAPSTKSSSGARICFIA